MTIEEFKSKLTAYGATSISRTTDQCLWYVDGRQVFLERATFPWNIFEKSYVRYWSETVYADYSAAELDALCYGGRVEQCFYCDEDNPTWFLIFDDIDKASAHALDHFDEFAPSTPPDTGTFRPYKPRFQHL
jgi:hypothetical protein